MSSKAPSDEKRTPSIGGEEVPLETLRSDRLASVVSTNKDGQIVNVSGHRDQLQRHYGLWSICSLLTTAWAITIDSAWIALGGSLAVSILNGGPPGVIYEFLTSCVYYGFIGASIAELASAVPASGGVYHWASVTPGKKWGRSIGFFTGWLNFFGWIFDLASIVTIPANVCVQFYVVFHPDFVVKPWHSYVAFVLITWICTFVCIFGNRLIPYLQTPGLFLIVVGGIVTIIVVAAMPSQHASNAFVWKDFENATGWNNGVAFLTGVLNGAFTIGTPDAITHMAEELPNPGRDLPRAVAAQIILGTISSFLYAVAIMYGINDLNAVITYPGSFPLAEVYAQATGNEGGTFGLLLIIFLAIMICCVGTFLTLSRIWWALARDNATPFPKFFSNVNERLSCPIPSTIFCAILCTGLGAIQLGSKTAFSDLVGSFIILTTTSYGLAIGSHVITGRKNVRPGPFWMGKLGFWVNGIAVVLIIFFNIMFCFPYAMPVSVPTMNYNSVILVGCIAVTAVWWLIGGLRRYEGPKLSDLAIIEGLE